MVKIKSLTVKPINLLDYGVFLTVQLPSGITKDLLIQVCPNGLFEAEAFALSINADFENSLPITKQNSFTSN